MKSEVAQVAIVTGAAGGIGAGIVQKFLQQGQPVLAVDLHQEALDALAQQYRSSENFAGPLLGTLAGDVCSDGDWQRIVSAATDFGQPGILINNAGISPKHQGIKAQGTEMSIGEWDQVLAVNLTGPFLGIRTLAPLMQAQGWGRIVNVASQAARTGARIAGVHYGASKAGLLGLTRSFAYELAPHGITVNAITPGRVDTPMAAVSSDELNEKIRQSIPIGRAGLPSEIADSVYYLTVGNTGFVTGATLDINGGSYMG